MRGGPALPGHSRGDAGWNPSRPRRDLRRGREGVTVGKHALGSRPGRDGGRGEGSCCPHWHGNQRGPWGRASHCWGPAWGMHAGHGSALWSGAVEEGEGVSRRRGWGAPAWPGWPGCGAGWQWLPPSEVPLPCLLQSTLISQRSFQSPALTQVQCLQRLQGFEAPALGTPQAPLSWSTHYALSLRNSMAP